jgi:hypothetical protein
LRKWRMFSWNSTHSPEEGEQEGEEEEEESDVVRELLSKHSAWLGLWGIFF